MEQLLDLDSKVLEFDATHSWNGYSYQGKVALIVVLELIIKLIEQGKSLESLKLEFEFIEDFSIKKDDQYIQIHQVKSYGPESLSKYKDAVWLLLGKSVYREYSSIKNTFLHVAEVITSNKGEINTTEKLVKVIDTYGDPSKSNSKVFASPFDLYEYVKENELKEVAFNKFQIYTYSDGKKYCTLSNIQEKVKEKILEYYTCVNKKEDLNNKGMLDRQVEYSYNFLLGLIDTHINERHINRQAKLDIHLKEIVFSNFLEILNKEYSKPPKSYFIYYLKNKLIRVFNEYYYSQKKWIKEQLEIPSQDSETIIGCEAIEKGLEKVMGILRNVYSNFNDDEFLLFCNRINPHIQISKDDDFLSVDELVNSEFIKSPWINTLVSLQNELDDEKLLINMNKQYYLASTIYQTVNVPSHFRGFQLKQANALVEASISNIAKKIIENRNIHSELYNIDNIITGNINASLKSYVHRVTDYKPINVDKEGYHIMDIKNVELIDLENSINRRENK